MSILEESIEDYERLSRKYHFDITEYQSKEEYLKAAYENYLDMNLDADAEDIMNYDEYVEFYHSQELFFMTVDGSKLIVGYRK